MIAAVFPWLYDSVMRSSDRGTMARWRRRVVRPASGRTLEIGAGTGLGFRHYGPGALVIAIDPDIGMLHRARPRATEAAARVCLVAADAERLPFRSRAFDTGIVQLALCTIAHPECALEELRRVLRPRAQLRLLEHVRVDHPIAARLQDWVTPIWKRVAGGCRLNRRTSESVASAGFDVERIVPHVGGLFLEISARAPASG